MCGAWSIIFFFHQFLFQASLYTSRDDQCSLASLQNNKDTCYMKNGETNIFPTVGLLIFWSSIIAVVVAASELQLKLHSIYILLSLVTYFPPNLEN